MLHVIPELGLSLHFGRESPSTSTKWQFAIPRRFFLVARITTYLDQKLPTLVLSSPSHLQLKSSTEGDQTFSYLRLQVIAESVQGF